MTKHWAIKKILQAFENKDVGYIQSLVLQQQINPNALIPSKGVSLLHLIIGHQSEAFAYEITKLFLRCGGNPNVQSSDGVTPIHVAAAWGRTRILHLLLVNGGDPWMQDDEKKNAFNYAFEEREWYTVEMLHHFHQMHSAATSKDFPKYERSLERVVLRKGDEMLAYTPSKKSMKSMTTQTQSQTQAQIHKQNQKQNLNLNLSQTLSDSSSSPVQDKIKYFEPEMTSSLDIDFPRDSEKNVAWLKDFYQASCEVIVHRGASESPEEKQETYVSSVHIEPSSVSGSTAEKSAASTADVRGQLFMELREAVNRRSKLKMLQEERNIASTPKEPVLTENDPSKDSFVAKEVSYLYGVNLEENGMLKNMSDFATKVMNEIEVSEADRISEKTVDLCISSPDLTGAYLSCEEDASRRKSDVQNIPNVQTFLIPQSNSETSNLYLTPFNSEIARDDGRGENSNESFMSVAEEYKYTDAEEGVVLLEKKLVVTPTIRRLCPTPDRHFVSSSLLASKFHDTRSSQPNPLVFPFPKKKSRFPPRPAPPIPPPPEVCPLYLGRTPAPPPSPPDAPIVRSSIFSFDEDGVPDEEFSGEMASSSSSTSSTVPSSLSYNSDVLRCELNGLGYHPGPITNTTKKLYLRKLWRLKKETAGIPVPEKTKQSCCSSPLVYSPVLEKTVTDSDFFDEIPTYHHLEEEMVRSFECWTGRKWRGGKSKTSFNYLLLDPRVSLNLPKRASGMTAHDAWKCFLSGIFYVGKGKRSRPYAHLYQATHFWEKRATLPPDEKSEKIAEIWKEGLGVVCLQVFQNIIPVEALTREAAMIEAMTVSSLRNVRSGEYYGAASTWSTKDKARLGTYLLHKAMLIFLNEGERQIKPYDID